MFAPAFSAENDRVLETGVEEGLAPCTGRGNSMFGPVGIRVTPPAVQLAEGHVLPAPSTQAFDGNQLTGSRQQVPAMAEGLAQIPRGVEDVDSNHEIIGVKIESLGRRVAFDVEGTVLYGGARIPEAVLRFGEEPCRNVGEDVVEVVLREFRQHNGCT